MAINYAKPQFYTYFLRILLLLLAISSSSELSAQRLIHNFEFNGNLNDTSPTGVVLGISNLASSSYDTQPNRFTWLQPSNPGGGLILETDQLIDPTQYSLGFRISFKETGSDYKKILSFKGTTVDNGLYFQNKNIEFYPFGKSGTVTFEPNTFYDFILTRNKAKRILVYIVKADGSVSQLYDKQDTSDASVPHLVNGKHEFRFFMDDNHTNSEHSSGGTVKGIRIWDKPLTPAQISASLSSVTTEAPKNVSSNAATLVGEVNPQGSAATFEFEYGITTSYGTTIPASPASSSGTSSIVVTADLTGLQKGQTYHYRLKSTNGSGVLYGSDISFVASPDHDNDGVPDSIDLDDDNDGILDTVEGAKATTVGTAFNTGSGTGNVTGTLSSASGSVTYNIAFQNVGNSGNGGVGNASDFFNGGKEISCASTAAGSDNTFTFTPQGTATLSDLEEVTVDVSWVSTGNVVTFNQALDSFVLKSGTSGSISPDGKTVTITSGANSAASGFTAKLSSTIVNPLVVNGKGTSSDTFTIKVAASIFDRPDFDSDGITNSLDLDLDGDGCNDVIEVYGNSADPDGDGIYGTGIPTVDANGLVFAAGITGSVYNTIPTDNDSDGTLDLFQATKTLTAITTQPIDVASFIANPAVFTIDYSATGTGSEPLIQWYTKKAGTTTEIQLTNTGLYAGVTSKTLTITGYKLVNNGDKFYAKISAPASLCSTSITSNEAALSIKTSVLLATDDAFTIIKTNTIVASSIGVHENDLLQGSKPILSTEVTLKKFGTSNSANIGFTANTGQITVNPDVPEGVYTMQYLICEAIDPLNCQTATVTVTVLNDSDLDGVADVNDLDDDNDGILDTVEGTCVLPTEMRLGYVPNARDLDGDSGYTFDGINMSNSLTKKIQNPANFGPLGIVKTTVILVPITTNPITKTALDNLNLDAVFIGGIDKTPTVESWLSDAEFTAIQSWSAAPGKTVIATQASATKWGRTLTPSNTNPNIPTTIGKSTSIFNGPFGNVTSFDQGGSYQAIFNANINLNDDVFAVDQNNEGVIIKNASHNDILISDVDVLTTTGKVSSGDGINNNNDRLALNLIYTAIPLSSCPGTDIDLDGLSNSLDLNTDGDACSDIQEVYGFQSFSNTSVDANGLVIAAGITGNVYNTLPSDKDADGIADFKQATKKLLGFNIQPADQLDILYSQNAVFTVTPNFFGTGTAPIYKWQVQVPGGSFSDITNNTIYSGATSEKLTVTNLNSTFSGNHYRVIVTSPSLSCDLDYTSNAAQLTIKKSPLALNPDTIQAVENNAVTLVANVLSNDLVNGVQATFTNATLTLASVLPSGLTFNTTTGEIATDGTLTSGTYTITYQVCETADPTNCTSGSANGIATITIQKDTDGDLVADINDLDDDNDGILDTAEDAISPDADADGIINSLDTDSDNDGCSDTKEVYGSTIDFGANPVVDANGLVIAAGISGVNYTELLKDNDINLVADFIQASKSVTGFSTQPKDHITNINKAVTFQAVAITSGSGTDIVYQWQVQTGGIGAFSDITNNANYSGATTNLLTVIPTDATFNGNIYRTVVTTPSYVCDADQTSSQALLLVNSHVINANNDATTLVEQIAATGIINVITNDFVNHIAATIADLNVTQVSTSNAGITLNTTTGAIDMTAAVTEGIYFLEYQICEKIDPTNCASGIVTIVVQKDTDGDGLPDATDPDIDNDGNLNGTDPNINIPVANNDSGTVKVGQATEIDLLSNDDFIPSTNTTITQTGGTAAGTITFDNLTGKLSYTPTLGEAGKTITVIYQVTNTPTSVSKTATVTLTVNDESDLSLTMVVSNAAPKVGDNITFTITAANGGPSNATNLDVNSKLSNGFTYVSSVPSAGTYNPTTGNWFVGSVANGAAPTLAITAKVNASGDYVQVAEVSFTDQSDPDSTAGNGNASEDDFATVTIIPTTQTDLVTVLSVDNTTPNEGDDVTYQIKVTNNGPSAATQVQVGITGMTTGITYKNDDGAGSLVQGVNFWTWIIGNLASGASEYLHITGTINNGQAGNTLNNTVLASLNETDPSTTGDVLTTNLSVNKASLTTTIVVDNTTPNEGDTVKYTINIANAGANSSTGIALTSVLPSGVTYVSDNGGGNYNSATGIWNPTTITNAGNATLEITTTVNSGTAGTTISNTVTKISTDQSTTNTVPAATADFTVKSINLVSTNTVDNATPNEGATIKYTLSVTNSGTDTATNVVVTDLLPTGITYVSDNGGGNYVSGTGVWTVGSIANGATQTLEISATVNAGTAGTHITNTISAVVSTETDTTVAGDSLSSTISIASANLVTVVAIPNSTPNVNDAYTYTITVTNNGPGNATGISLTSAIPSGVTHTSSSATVGTYVNGTGVWTIGAIASGSSAVLTINTTVNADQGNILNTISSTAAAGDQTDSTTSGDLLSKTFTPTSANLITVFSVNNPTPDEGDSVIFTVKVRNAGPSNETNVKITTDVWPIIGVTYVSDDSLGAYVNGTGVWTIGNLASGTTATLKVTGTVNAASGGNTYTFKSIAPASGDQTDLITTGDALSASITVQQAKLSTSITVNNPSPNVGSTVTYTVTVKNNGPSTDNNVSLTSLVPSGLTYVGSTPSIGTYNNGSGLWSIGSIANGATQTLTITATVDAGQGGNTINSSTTAAVGDHTDTSISNPNLSTSIIVTSANLITVKTVNNPLPDEGDTIIYSINVTNNGPNDETNVSLTDLLPSGVTYVSETASQGTYVNGTGVWTIGGIANGDTKTLAITATVDAATSGTTITNTTTTASGDQSDPTTSGDVLSADIKVTTSDIITVMSVSNTTPNEGDSVVYTINVTNNGPNNDTGVSLTTAVLSALSGVTYVSDDGAGAYASGSGVWTIGAITSGDTKTLNITTTVDTGTGGSLITNTTSAAFGAQGDPSTLGDVLSAAINVTSANLITTISVDNANPNEGDTISYTINVNNNGPNDETNVSLEDHLPSGITFVSATTANGSYSNATGVWTIGSIPKYTATSLVINGTVDSGQNAQTITNTIVNRASGDQSDPTTAGDNLSASLIVSSANLVTVISVDNPTPNEGDAIVYSIVVTNNGPNNETAVSLTSLLPSGINLTSAIATQGSYASGTGLWSAGNIAKNTSETLTLIGTVASSASLTNPITTTTTAAKGSIADSNTAGDILSAVVTVTQSDLVTTINVDNPIPNEGDTIKYTLHVTNNGPNNETNASLTSTLPNGVTYISDTGSGAYNAATGLWTIGSITKNSAKSIIITAKVNANTSGSTVTTTTTAANGDQTDPSTTSDVLSTSITVGSYADIVLRKTVDNSTPNAGDTINYTISVTNNGPANVTNLVISDVLPTGLTFVNEFAGTGVWNTGASTWTLTSLASGDTKNLIIETTVNADQGGNIITNTISNTQDQTDSNATPDDDIETITVTETDLSSNITVDNTTPNEGDTVKYSITVNNASGSSKATNVNITDLLPTGVTYISSTTTNGTYNSGSGLWNIGDLNGNTAALLIIEASVNVGTGGTTITNTTFAPTADQSDSNTTADILSVAITVTSSDLVTTKIVDVSNPTEGQDIVYTISVTNNAGTDATGVTLTDRLPAGVTYKNDDSGLYNSTSGEWTIGNISAGATSTINITATVNSGTGNTTITNTTTAASGDQSDPTTVGDDLTESITVVSTDLVTVNSVDVTQANIGDTVTYTITVTNNGPSGATNVVLTDILPSGITYVSDNTGGNYVAGTGVWTIGSIANGTSQSINILATVDASSGGKTINNVIAATAAGSEADATTANDVLEASFNVISNDLVTNLTVDKANPNEGDAIVYTLTVKNNGPSTATGVSITDNLPTGVTYTGHATVNGTFNSGAGIWSIGSLAKGSEAALSISATVNNGSGGTTITNTTLAASANYNDPNTANNTSSISITVGNSADIVVTNSVDNATPNVGDTITFTITATNSGPSLVQNLVVKNTLPNGLTYGLVTPGNGTWTSPNWTIGTLASGVTETLTIKAVVEANTGGQHLTNTISNSQTQTDSNLTADDFDAIVTVTSANLITSKTVNTVTPNEGDAIKYTISITNNGPNDATGISLTDILPAGVTYVNDDASGAYNLGSGIWNVGSLANGATIKLNIDARVDVGQGGSSIVNITTAAKGNQTDPTTAGDNLSASISVSSAELVTIISVDNTTPSEGELISYAIAVNNQGSSDATNVSLTTNLPSGVTFDSFVAPSGTTFNQGSGVWSLGAIAANATKTLLIKAKVNIATGGTTITNTTSAATGDQSDPNGVPDILSKTITVLNASDILVSKTVNNSTPNVGDIVTYTITVENKSGAQVNNFVLTDVLPNGLTFGTVTATKGTWTSPNWSITTLDVNDTQTLTVNAAVDAGTGGLSLTNTVLHTQTQTDSNATADDLSETITITSANLVTELSVDNASPNEGDTIQYSLTITNKGTSDANGISLIDNLPAGITYVSHTVSSGAYNIGSGEWNGLSLTNSNSATLTITAMVNSGTGGTTITNTSSTATGNQSDPTTVGDITSIAVNVSSSNLVTVKSVDNTKPNEGDTIIYTIQVTNNGPLEATNVSLTDKLPTGVTYVSDDASGNYNNSTGFWTIGTIANAGIKTINITATVDSGTGISQTAIVNTTTAAKGDQSDPTIAGDVLSAEINVPSVNLVTNLTVNNATPNVGDTIEYTISVVNQGPSIGTDIQLTDVLPAGLEYLSDDGSGRYNSTSGLWSLGDLMNGAVRTLTIKAVVKIGEGGNTILNTITAAKGKEFDATSNLDNLSVVINVTSSDLITVKSVSTLASGGNTFEGEVIEYTITVFNNGNSDATNVSLTDNLPVGVTYRSHSVSNGVYNSGSGYWSIGNILNNDTSTLIVNASVDSGQAGNTITNTTSKAVGDQSDPTTIGDDLSAVITVANSSDIVLTKIVDNKNPDEGDIISYTITVTSKNGAALTNLVVTDALPSGLTYDSAITSIGTWASPNWDIGSLAAGQTETIIIKAKVNIGTLGLTLTNTVSNTQDQIDSNLTQDDDTETISVTNVDLEVIKTVSNQSPNEGDAIIYTIKVHNIGPNDATGVSITDVLPNGVSYIGHFTNEGNYNQGSGLWTIGGVLNGAVATLTINVTVDAGTAYNNITNITSNLIADQADPNTSNNIGSVTITPGSTIDLSLTKNVVGGNTTPIVGDIVTYEIVISNEGPNLATGIVVNDLLPSGLKFVRYNSSSIYNETSGNWNVGSLAKNNTKILFIEAEVLGTGNYQNCTEITAADQFDADSIPNNAIVTEDDYACADISPQAQVDVVLTKTVDNNAPNEGDIITYTITAKNNGPANATELIITDAIPAGLTFISAASSDGTWTTPNWNIGLLKSGTIETLTIQVQVDAGTGAQTIINTISKSQTQTDSDNTTDDLEESITVTNSDLAVSKTVSNLSPNEGDTVVYEIVIDNNGPNDATGVSLLDVLPVGVTYVSHSTINGSFNQASGFWNVGMISNGNSAALQITSTINTGTTNQVITNTTSALTADQSDSDATNNIGSVSITPGSEVDVIISKRLLGNNSPKVGDTVNYEISVTNSGPNSATGLLVKDLLPSGLRFITYNSSSIYNSTTGIWNIGSLTTTETKVLIVEVEVLPSGIYENCAEVTAIDQGDSNLINNKSCVTIIPSSVADLELIMNVDDLNPLVDSNITFTIRLTNNGPSNANNVEVTDVLPSGFIFLNTTTSTGTYDDFSGNWSINSIATNTSETLTITAKVLNIGDWVNIAEITASSIADPDSTPGNSNVDEDDYAIINTLKPNIVVKIPEIFTPNGDNINETFTIPNLHVEYPKYNIQIVNRYGDKVFEYKHNGNPTNQPISWDGKSLNGGLIPSGTYFYTIYFNDGNRKPKTGWINLRR